MHLQSTAVFLVTLLSATQAIVPKTTPPPDICASEKTAVVNAEFWINGNQNCIDDGTIIQHPIQDFSGSQPTDIDQKYCYDLTPTSSYKVWQANPIGSAVVCTFAVYPEYACKGTPLNTTYFPTTESKAGCVSSIVGPGPEPDDNDWWPSADYGLFPFQGYKSTKLSCKCNPPPTKPLTSR